MFEIYDKCLNVCANMFTCMANVYANMFTLYGKCLNVYDNVFTFMPKG